MLDYFAFIVLLILIAVVIAAWIMLAMMPGQIARTHSITPTILNSILARLLGCCGA